MTRSTNCKICRSAVTSDDLRTLRICDECCWWDSHRAELEMLIAKSGLIGRLAALPLRVRLRKIENALKNER